MENINIEEIIYKWFDMKYHTYDKLDQDGCIYLYYEGQEYAEILIEKNPKYIFYDWAIYKEFYEIIPIERNVFQGFISKWVEDTFNLMGNTPWLSGRRFSDQLKIPKINN